MAIKFACEDCGKRYSVSDDAMGKKFKCRQCGTVGIVPQAAATPIGDQADGEETSEEISGAGACPECGTPLPPTAVFCVECGLDLRTGQAAEEAFRPTKPERDLRPLVKPIAIGSAGLIALVGVVIVFLVLVRPALSGSMMDKTRELAKRGRLAEAAQKFEEMADKVPRQDRATVARMAAIMRLQNQMVALNPTAVGDVVLMGHRSKVEGAKLQKLVVEAAVQNGSEEPVTLTRECFYLYGSGYVSFPYESSQDPFREVVVQAGDTGWVTVEFTAVPGPGLGLASASPTSPVYVIYNDGVNYTSRPVDLLALLD